MIRSMALIVALALTAAEEKPSGSPGTCPISGRPGKPEFASFSEGRSYRFCSDECRGRFTAERENRLSEKQAERGFRLLFNGKDLEGFQEPTRTGKWEVRAGVLTGFGGPGVLATKQAFDHFVLQADIRVQDKGTRRGNSGIFIRSSGLTALRGRWPDGPEIQVDHGDPNYWTGAIWKKAKAKKVTTKDGEWFHMRIEAKGKRIRVWVNGKLRTDHRQEGEVMKGPIALQVHHPTDLVEFKNLKLLALKGP